MVTRQEHGGNLRKLEEDGTKIIDFSANINPLGPPEWLRPVISSTIEDLIHYPDPDNVLFREAIALHHGIDPQMIVAGNGTAELLYVLLSALPQKRVVIPVPCYIDYHHASLQAEKEVVAFPLYEEDNFVLDVKSFDQVIEKGDIAIIGLPNNPTGVLPNLAKLEALLQKRNDVLFILDEAFLSFVEGAQSFAGKYTHVVTLNSMTKFFALPGLRIGYTCLATELAEKVREGLPPWSVNTFAQKVGEKLYADLEYRKRTLEYMAETRQMFVAQLESFSELKVYAPIANYVFCKLLKGQLVKLVDKLHKYGYAIRNCDNYQGLGDQFFRVAIKTTKENNGLIEALGSCFGAKKPLAKKKKTPALMLQGTCSNAGKSVLTAAFCRILSDDGFSVAPFKAQNMSLNSFVTHDNREMGRAQVVQAQAARILPDYRMNPILLKPNSHTGSQVIVDGHAVGNMSVREYHAYKSTAWERVRTSYGELASAHQAIILEGAGSPGEVNLKTHDIVNMRMAQYAKSPVLLVGDIDRGGVYASFVGIMEVLAEWERAQVAGFLVNRFRGDSRLLQSAHDYVDLHCKRPTLGVVPYLENLGIPEEDSVSFKAGHIGGKAEIAESVKIVVISLPHISNFTDIEPFLGEADVELNIISQISELADADAIIIPGSKNVIGDIQWLKENGFFRAIKAAYDQGVSVVGICGGYQILGQRVDDPHGIESDKVSESALGLLDMNTAIQENKSLIQKTGTHLFSGQAVKGYEIHHGTSSVAARPVFTFSDGTACGTAANERLWGAYLHGMFDEDGFRRDFINTLRKGKGFSEYQSLYCYDLENAFDRLAGVVRTSVDMENIYSIMGV